MLLPTDTSWRTFQGFVNLLGKEYFINLEYNQPELPSAFTDQPTFNRKKLSLHQRGLVLKTEVQLSLILEPFQSILEQKMEQFSNFEEFWADLNQYMERILSTSQPLPPHLEALQQAGIIGRKTDSLPSYFSKVLFDLETIGWDNVDYLSPGMDEVHYHIKDSKNRQHIVQLKYPSQYPVNPPAVLLDVPNFTTGLINLPPALEASKSWLFYIQSEITRTLESFSLFFDVMDEIDRDSTILEPQPIKRSHFHRRIGLESLCSIEIEVNPDHPHAVPAFRLYGPSRRLAPLKANLEKNLSSWDVSSTLKNNLEKALGTQFPNKTTFETENDLQKECGICYSYRLASQSFTQLPTSEPSNHTPILVCDNSSCNTVFHHSCLFESIKSLPTSRRSYKVWFGSCPYCNEPIMVTEI